MGLYTRTSRLNPTWHQSERIEGFKECKVPSCVYNKATAGLNIAAFFSQHCQHVQQIAASTYPRCRWPGHPAPVCIPGQPASLLQLTTSKQHRAPSPATQLLGTNFGAQYWQWSEPWSVETHAHMLTWAERECTCTLALAIQKGSSASFSFS